MPTTVERKPELPPFKSRLQDWYERARSADDENATKILTEGYAILFDILDPFSEEGKIDPEAYARFHLIDRRLKHFDEKFLTDKFTTTGIVKVKDYRKSRTDEKHATIVITDGFNIGANKSINISYEPRTHLQYMSATGTMKILETDTAWVRHGDKKVDKNETRSITELKPTQLLALTLSLAHIYSEDREKH